jgi:hypothetical protein
MWGVRRDACKAWSARLASHALSRVSEMNNPLWGIAVVITIFVVLLWLAPENQRPRH